MMSAQGPDWRIREETSEPVLLALYLRQVLVLRAPEDLPYLRGIPPLDPRMTARSERAQAALERQWRSYWEMTVEPQANRSSVPLELVEGFGTMLALPIEGADELRAAITPLSAEARDYAHLVNARHLREARGDNAPSNRSYATAIADFEREAGRPANAFELNVQVLPLQQRGVWWIGALTIAVTDGLRNDVAAFGAAINPIIAELA